MPEKLTWDEIKRTYPDEWVVLVDVDTNDRSSDVDAGVVVGYGTDCRELVAQTKETLAGKSAAILFTGEVGMGKYLYGPS